MPWFAVDDSFSDHEKHEKIEDDHVEHALAVAAWTMLGSDCAKPVRATGGFVSHSRLAKVLSTWPAKSRAKAAAALVKAGFWSVVEGGWQFHDWEDYQPTAEEIEQDRKLKTERQRRWRKKKREERLQSLGRVDGVDASTVDALVDGSVDDEDAREDESTSTPTPSRALGARSGGRAHVPQPLSPTPERESAFDAQRMRVIFQKSYLDSKRSDPAMGGKNLGDFPARVLRTAKAQQRDPEALYREKLETWLKRSLNEKERKAPYACFAQAWGELTTSGVASDADGSPKKKHVQPWMGGI